MKKICSAFSGIGDRLGKFNAWSHKKESGKESLVIPFLFGLVVVWMSSYYDSLTGPIKLADSYGVFNHATKNIIFSCCIFGAYLGLCRIPTHVSVMESTSFMLGIGVAFSVPVYPYYGIPESMIIGLCIPIMALLWMILTAYAAGRGIK